MSMLTTYNQQNCLTLLTYDDNNFLLARNTLVPELFDYPYNRIVEKCINYIDTYKRPPKDHVADEIERELQGPDAERYREAIQSINHLKENLDTKYVIEKLTEFIRGQRFEKALYDAAALHAQGKDIEAMEAMRSSLDANLTIFDPGIKITDLHLLKQSLEESDIIYTGIQALDAMQVGPAKGEMFMFLGERSRGKSWFAIQAAKMAMWHNLKVVHISLEISEKLVLQRYIQNILSLTKWQAETIETPFFHRDSNGEVTSVDRFTINTRSLADPETFEYIQAGLARIGPRVENNIRIKAFPTGQLTLPRLRAYLDGLERTQNYKPDMVVLDMPMNMDIPLKDFRLAMGRLIVNLRGLAVERNFALFAPHQLSKEGAKATFATGLNVAEDWSAMGTVDTAAVLNQKSTEFDRGLARIYIDRGRSMQSQFTVLILQALKIGQFCLDSVLLPKTYSVQMAQIAQNSHNEEESEHRNNGNLRMVRDAT